MPLFTQYPVLTEWLGQTPLEWRELYESRADELLAVAPNLGTVVLRVMLTERRLGLWAIRAERARRRDKKVLLEALRELTTAEKDTTKAWTDYIKAVELFREGASSSAARQPVGGYVDLLGEGPGTPGFCGQESQRESGGPKTLSHENPDA